MARLSVWSSVSGVSYPAPFHRLVLIGTLYTDTFNTTVSMIPGLSGTVPAVTDELLDEVRTVVATWFPKTVASTGCQIISEAKLTSIKLNRIGTDGLYMDPEPKEWVYTTPISGGGSSRPPGQLSHVVTLRGLNERARAGKGRMYIPTTDPCGSVGTDGRLSAANALDQAEGVATLLHALDDAYLAAGVNAVAGIASKTGSGAFQALRNLSCGRVVDTMRSRRNKLDEDPSVLAYG